jgi:hypothetical protein
MEQVFSFPWEHAPAGFHRLFVGATDNLGLSTRSEPVLIHVRPGPDIPIVNIFAPDPLAAEDGSPGRPANPALFRVRRSGPTAAPLVVDYEIGGTAENGADYRRISGQVTLLAGRHSAGIEIVPIDDDLPEFAETVVLKLFVAVDSDPPPYQVGRFSKAAAVIVDRDQPWPHCRSLPDGLVHLCRPLIPSGILQVEAAPDPLGEWEPVGILTASEEAIHFVDAETPDWPTRCYRFVSVTANPVAVED